MISLIYLSIAIVLALVELVTLKSISVFFSFTAFVLAIVTLIYPINLIIQLSVFFGLSIFLLLVLRKAVVKKTKRA